MSTEEGAAVTEGMTRTAYRTTSTKTVVLVPANASFLYCSENLVHI